MQDFLLEAEKVDFEGFILDGTKMMAKTKSLHYLFWKEIQGDVRKILSYMNKQIPSVEHTREDWINLIREPVSNMSSSFLKEKIGVLHNIELKAIQEAGIDFLSLTIPNLIMATKQANLIFEEIPKKIYKE